MSDITPADALRELGDDQAEYAAAAAKKVGEPTWSGLFGAGGPDFDPDPDDTEGRKKIAELEAEVERLRTWIRKGPELRRTWAAEERAERAEMDASMMHTRVADAEAEVARLAKVLDEIRDVINEPANSYILEAKQTRGVLMRHMGSDWLSAEESP